MTGLIISLSPGLANIDVYTAARIESGAANNNAIIVTLRVPRNNGQIPNLGLSDTGIHVLLSKVDEGLSSGVFVLIELATCISALAA